MAGQGNRKPHGEHKPVKVRETAAVCGDEAAGSSRRVPAGEFKARCLALMDDVRDRGGEYVITKRGTPVAKLVPVRVKGRPLLGSMTGTVTATGDLVNPLDEPWDVFERLGDEG